MKFSLPVPREFSFKHSLSFLQRSPREVLHRVSDREVTKAIRVGATTVLFKVTEGKRALEVELLNGITDPATMTAVQKYLTQWFDLETDLKPFYKMASDDLLLKELIKSFHGYRIIGQPDLFESLIWAVLGQQINLAFAYTLKQRFVEKYGDKVEWNGTTYHLFPTPQKVLGIKEEELLALQFSRQKSRYTVGIAEAFVSGAITPTQFLGRPLSDCRDELVKIKGIGNWTANYALMKTYRYPDAFPLEDAGLHNAIRKGLNLKSKPSLSRVKKIFKKYKGWEAYATLYLWKSL